MRMPVIRNLIAQSKAKQVLREVREIPANFPNFAPELDDRVTFVAYGLLAAGCSLIEQGQTSEGHAELETAADILESAHQTEVANCETSALHCLIGAMAFYACGQYSRAFVLIGSVEELTPAAGIVASFLRKSRPRLISKLNAVLLAPSPSFDNSSQFDDWALTICVARSVALVAEHAISGEPELLANADVVLRDAMTISEGASHPTFWWLARLLRLMFKDYGNSSLWSVLPPFFGPDGIVHVDSYVKLLAFLKPPVIELWQSQTTALQLALNPKNKGGVINLRTSAGKTRVAELAILHTLSTDPSAKVLYLAPFRSLAFELEKTFTRTLVPLGYSVSHLYGGSRFSGVDREMVNEGRITIVTPEKAKAMLRAAPELFEAVKLIVIDEGHLLGGNERNVRNEMFLEHLRLLARQRGARILLLSAVLPNAEDLAAWVGGGVDALVKSNWKPSAERFGTLQWKASGVSIEWLGGERCFNPHFIEFKEVPKGKKGKRMFPESKTEGVAATAVRLAELGPVLVFTGQARWVPSMAKAILLAFGPDEPFYPWPATEWRLFEAVCKEELGDNPFELAAARVGVICHSNKLPPQIRISIEKLMAKCPPRIIVATTTLGQGVNIGISSVIVATTSIGQSKISKRDFWNICGRAGRAFVDSEGKVLFAIDMTGKPWQVRNAKAAAKEYFNAALLDKVDSGLLYVVGQIHKIAGEAGISFEVLLELAANDNFDRCGVKKDEVLGFLDWIDDQLLALHVAYKGDDPAMNIDWVDDAFRDSLAAIQESAKQEVGHEGQLMGFLKARVKGILLKVPTSEARRSVIASGLPLSVGVVAFDQLDVFRRMVDRYLGSEQNEMALSVLVLEFETWARQHAKTIVEKIPEQVTLDKIRPQWLEGASLRKIVETCGDESTDICTDLYGYQLPWLFHSIAQKLDKSVEETRVQILAKVGLLVELGLPTETAAKVFLAGVRSRTAAVELACFVTNPVASVSRIRNALLDSATVKALSALVSESTLEWLNLLSAEHSAPEVAPPQCTRFRLDAPGEVNTLHVRQQTPQGSIFLCSTDARFKYAVRATEEMLFDKFANNPRFIFARDSDAWIQQCRDPRIDGLSSG
ncbi:MAG: DEAD/DEAH box helicase [Candidatus Competibacteraceae bacterium]|nr:DEAD/DEAH box helicase [Candidatus Competibacteraceae bacterium]